MFSQLEWQLTLGSQPDRLLSFTHTGCSEVSYGFTRVVVGP